MKPLFALRLAAAVVLPMSFLSGCGAGVAGDAGPQLISGTSTHVDAPPATPAAAPAAPPASP